MANPGSPSSSSTSGFVFSIVGDSNIRQHMSTTNCRDRPMMSEAQIILCSRMSLLDASLSSVRAESNVVVLSCLTDFITSCSGSTSVQVRVEPSISSLLSKITTFASSRQDVQVFVGPPMYRISPEWYRSGMSEILQKFSSVFKIRPANVHLLPSFPSPALDSDGIHLTPYSGLEFVLHLFDSVQVIMANLKLPSEKKSSVFDESNRVLGDRVMVLEQDVKSLHSRFEMKSAIDAELSDLQENIRNESFVMIQGMKRLPKLDPKEWQVRVKSEVSALLGKLMGHEVPVEFVLNSTGRGKNSKVLYKVKLESAELSRSIRNKYGYFFSGGKDSRPSDFSGVSIRNCVTTATLARIAILQLYGKRYCDSNPGAKSQVVGFEPRPLLKLIPPQEVTDKKTQTFTFIEAVTKLPSSFTPEEIEGLVKRISPKLFGRLRSLFVVINDDMVKKKAPSSEVGRGSKRSSSPSSAAGAPKEKR